MSTKERSFIFSDPTDVQSAMGLANGFKQFGTMIVVGMGPNIQDAVLEPLASAGAYIRWPTVSAPPPDLAAQILQAISNAPPDLVAQILQAISNAPPSSVLAVKAGA